MSFFEYVDTLAKGDPKLQQLYNEEKGTDAQSYQREVARLREEVTKLKNILQSNEPIAAPAFACNIKFFDYVADLSKRDPQLRKLYLEEIRTNPPTPRKEIMRLRDEIGKIRASIKSKNAGAGGPVASPGAGMGAGTVKINAMKPKVGGAMPSMGGGASMGGTPRPTMGGGNGMMGNGMMGNGMMGNGMMGNGMMGGGTPAAAAPTPTPSAPPPPSEPPAPQIDVSKYEREVEEAKARADAANREKEQAQTQAKEWENKYNQAYESLANTRKVLEKDVADEKKMALQGMIKELIPVVDSFDIVFRAKVEDERMKSFIEGFKMTYNKLINLLKQKNVEILVPHLGDEYNSDFMEAIQATEGPEDNKVVEIFGSAFKLNDILIRPARVIISKKQV